MYLVAGFAFYVCSYFFRALRFHILLIGEAGLSDLFNIVCVHNMVNNILPAEFEIISFTPEILEEILHTEIPEIHDRIIVATAKFYRVGILTKEKIIRESGEIEKL